WCTVGRPPRGIVLDMDSSVSPTHGEQELSVWDGHYTCTCYHPLFVFNQFGYDALCVPAMCTAPTAGRGCLSRHLFPGRCSLRDARGLRVPGGRVDQICDLATRQPSSSEQDRLSAQASGRQASKRSPTILRQLHLPGGKLDKAAPGDCQGQVASGRAL